MTRRYLVLAIAIGAAAMLLSVAYVLTAKDQFADAMRKQGYKLLKHPRNNFGVGSVIPLDSNKNIYIASQAECFPGLEERIQRGKIKLLDSTDDRNLSINAAGNYAPGGAGFLGRLAA